MITLKYSDLAGYEKGFHPADYFPKNWSGTALDILGHKTLPNPTKFWLVLRPEILTQKSLDAFGAFAARQAEPIMTDARSKAAITTLESYAKGTATKGEKDAAIVSAKAAMPQPPYTPAGSIYAALSNVPLMAVYIAVGSFVDRSPIEAALIAKLVDLVNAES